MRWCSRRFASSRSICCDGVAMEEVVARVGGAGLSKPARPLTHRSLETMRPEAQPYRVPDERCRGLAVRVSVTGRITYDLSFRIKGGVGRRVSLGSFPQTTLEDARNRAQDLMRAARSGRDLLKEEAGAKAEAAKRLTVGHLIDRYVGRSAAGKLRTGKDIERRLRRSLMSLETTIADEVRRRDLRELFDSVADSGFAREAEKRRQTVGAMFRWAMAADFVENDPTAGLPRYDGGQPRDRILTADEIRTVWAFLDQQVLLPAHADVLRLQLLIGARCGEIAGLSVDEIDQSSWIWTLPAARSKNNKPRMTPVVGLARKILAARMPRGGAVFISQAGSVLTSALVSSTLRNHRSKIPIPHFGTHDLRRTVASGMDDLGVSEETTAAVLGHESSASRQTRTTRRHYIHTDRIKRKRAAVLAWNDQMRSILCEQAPTVHTEELLSLPESTIT
jgi:integrase